MERGERAERLRRTVALVGMPGAGKTSVGMALARLLAAPFLDTDREIEAAAGRTIAEIFAEQGETFFRDRETRVLRRLLGGPPAILSTGGGLWLQPDNRALIARHGVSVWLDADLDLLWERVRRKDTRPLLRTGDPRATLARLHEERVPLYRMADIRVKAAPGLTVDEMARRVRDALRAHADHDRTPVLETAP